MAESYDNPRDAVINMLLGRIVLVPDISGFLLAYDDSGEALVCWDRDIGRFEPTCVPRAYVDGLGVMTIGPIRGGYDEYTCRDAGGSNYYEFRRDPVPYWADGLLLSATESPRMQLDGRHGVSGWVYV